MTHEEIEKIMIARFTKETGEERVIEWDNGSYLDSYVEYLHKQLALYNVSRWVAVSEQKPQINKRVLLYRNDYMFTGLFTEYGWVDDEGWLYDNDEPTHWKQLPEPPCC